ncbi:hypothetical protein [Actinomadura sp. 21ATH]
MRPPARRILWIQAVKGITADGVYGPETRGHLRWAKIRDNQVIGCL